MANDAVWEIEPHTKAKHELLRRYLGAWFPILTSSGWNRRVIFLDGFAGPGIYSNGEPGSPIIALDTLVNHPYFAKLNHTEFVFLFVEAENERFVSLEHEIARFWSGHPGGQPGNVLVRTYNATFAEVATDLVSFTRDEKKQLAPMFAFVDPFGWSGVPLALIRDLLAFDKCEVLFNFMYDSVNRFVTDERPGVARHFAELFGTTEAEYRAAESMTGDERKGFLRSLYVQQLRDVGGFRHVRSFELVDVDRGRTAYYLVFGTRYPKGLEVMKDAMWALDPVTGARFAGLAGAQQMLFAAEVDIAPLRTAILQRFAGQLVSVDQIEQFVIEDTDYKTTHYKKAVLRDLEDRGIISCESDRKKRLTYPKGTMLRFPPAL
jgi:three-Cys-motif partner protein